MRILVIGSGGREHALAWKLSQNHTVFASPGNPGSASLAPCLPAKRIEDYLAIAERNAIDLTVVGPEAPLVEGIVDLFRSRNKLIFGPTKAAAQLEGSKAFSKAFMLKHGIPTARAITAESVEGARKAVSEFGFPVVLKADGLAAGKGVVIAREPADIEPVLPTLLANGRVIVEEFLTGEEVSFIVISDGRTAVPLQTTQDHKAAFDGDLGPNTGGMGAYRDSRILSPAEHDIVMEDVIDATLEGMAADGEPFTGFLYAGLMMTAEGPKVLEFNARLGDPETQPLMHGLRTDFAEVLASAARRQLSPGPLDWAPGASVCVVLAAHGYPGQVRTGDTITGIEQAEQTGATVFHAGTRESGNSIQTAGGRVLGVTASGADLAAAIHTAYEAVSRIQFDGMHYRKDIGQKGLRRLQ